MALSCPMLRRAVDHRRRRNFLVASVGFPPEGATDNNTA